MLKLILTTSVVAVALGATVPLNHKKIDDLIVGGKDTDISEVPYQVSLHINDGFICGGSIVSSGFVVTAAHCFDKEGTKNVKIRAGSSTAFGDGVMVTVGKVYIHPKYNETNSDKDVAVLELKKPLKFTEKIKPVALATSEPKHGYAKTSGWGALDETGGYPEQLQSVDVPIVDHPACKKAFESHKTDVTDYMICAGAENTDSCNGDSGGPLVLNGELVGIVSFGIGCARKELPGVYTNVAHPEIITFIKKHVKA